MGVTYDKEQDKFIFNFEHDGIDDIVSLTGHGYQMEAFGKCFYYGYQFQDTVDGSVRSAFIKYVKFPESIQADSSLTQFIKKAIDDLNDKINLYDYDLVVMPESSSKLNQYMLRYIYRFNQPKLIKVDDLCGEKPDEALCASIRQQNVLVVQQTTTIKLHIAILSMNILKR